ncbi:hypothetical protein IKR55_04180 [bacterium]|nr:hypothetical protein [bacterium]
MNNSYYETLDENFTQALNLYEQEYSHEELVEFLASGNIVQKQIAALQLDTIKSSGDAKILLDNLTGQDGKIREAVSLRLKEFMSDNDLIKYFEGKSNYQIFLDSVIDINANICRNVISAISNLKSDEEFCEIFCSGLSEMTKSYLDIVEKFNFQEGKYKVNKEVFKLYWCLETMYEFYDKINFEDLKEIIKRAKNIQEYTIREKAAKILSRKFDDSELEKIRQELKNDDNYYVRRF